MKMTTGTYVSGAGHLILILWVLLGGVLFRAKEPPFEFANVSLVSSADFAAMEEAAAPREQGETQPEPAEPEAPASPAPEATPRPQPRPEPAPEPAPEPEPEPAPEPPAPAAVPDAGSTVLTNQAEAPAPQQADTVAETETAPPPEDAPEAPEQAQAAQEQDEPTAEPVVEQQAAAPPPTTTAIVTEADTPAAGGGALAPESSRRPRARPERLAAAPAPQPERPVERPAATAAEPEAEEEESVEDAIAAAAADAVAAALAAQAPTTSEQGGAGLAASGPPLTGGERDGFRLAVQACWVVDPGSEASRVSVTVGFELDQSGKVVNGPTMVASGGGSDAAIRTAFEAARRAILRCQRDGFDLPAEKYQQWREVEMTFDASGGRIR